MDDALAATGFKVVNLPREFADKWVQAQADAAVVAAVALTALGARLSTRDEVRAR